MNSNFNHYTLDQLIPFVQNGDTAAYAVFCQKVCDMLLNSAIKKLRNEEEAKDVVQDILFWIWEHRDQLGEITNIHAYLYKMVTNRSADLMRSESARRKREQLYSHSCEQVSVSIPIEIKELGEELHLLINMISPASKEAFIKSYLEKKNHREIAIEMNINVQSVRNNISRALKFLRSQLKKNSI